MPADAIVFAGKRLTGNANSFILGNASPSERIGQAGEVKKKKMMISCHNPPRTGVLLIE